MIKYLKPSGIEMDVNDSPVNRELAERLGWKEVKEEVQENLKLEPEKSKSKPKKNDK